MKTIHLATCPSTSLFLQEKLESGEENEQEILISTDHQTAGMGRKGNTWTHLENALAFSFTLTPQKNVTLTSLEVGVILINFLKTFGKKLQLKWPNDLINSRGEKCGGFICQLHREDLVVVGVGINLGKADFCSIEDAHTPPGSVDEARELSDEEKERIPKEIYRYFLNNRLSAKEIQSSFTSYCSHVGQKVKVIDDGITIEGTFKGIGASGEAIIATDDGDNTVISGTLVQS